MQHLIARRCGAILVFALALTPVLAQTSQPARKTAKAKPRVLVTEGNAWEKDSKSKTPSVVKDLVQKCPDFVFTMEFQKPADYFLMLDHAGESGGAPAEYKLMLFDQESQTLATPTAAGLGDAMKGACDSLKTAVKKVEEKEAIERGSAEGPDGKKPAYIEETIDLRDPNED